MDEKTGAKQMPKTKKAIGVLIAAGLLVAGISLFGCSASKTTTVSNTELESVTVTKVVDGDTLKVRMSDGSEERVRLIGIDTPESVHPDESKNTEEGVKASDVTKELVSVGSTVWLQKDTSDRDDYDRLLRYVWLEVPSDVTNKSEVASKMLNAILIVKGTAQVKSYPPDTAYDSIFRSL